MRFLPSSASSKLLISEFTCAAVDIRLLWRLHAKNLSLLTKNSRYQCSVRIHESNLDSAYSKTLRGMAPSAHHRKACRHQLVIPSEARDLGSCWRTQNSFAASENQVPRFARDDKTVLCLRAYTFSTSAPPPSPAPPRRWPTS